MSRSNGKQNKRVSKKLANPLRWESIQSAKVIEVIPTYNLVHRSRVLYCVCFREFCFFWVVPLYQDLRIRIRETGHFNFGDLLVIWNKSNIRQMCTVRRKQAKVCMNLKKNSNYELVMYSFVNSIQHWRVKFNKTTFDILTIFMVNQEYIEWMNTCPVLGH